MTSITHVLYQHAYRAREIHVACRRCSGRALASKPSEESLGPIIGDCAGTWNLDDWQVLCDECFASERGLAYRDLPQPYYQVEARGVALWAWNLEHLRMLLALIERRDPGENAYRGLSVYARKDWMHRRNSKHLAKAIRRRWIGDG